MTTRDAQTTTLPPAHRSTLGRVRQRTVFQVCDSHAAAFAGLSRRRLAEFFCEGGPADGKGCSGADKGCGCRIWPGADIFAADLPTVATGAEEEWPRQWKVNQRTGGQTVESGEVAG